MVHGPQKSLLLEMYKEERKPCPDMKNITFGSLGLDYDTFLQSISNLQEKDMIHGALIYRDAQAAPIFICMQYARLTDRGTQQVKKLA